MFSIDPRTQSEKVVYSFKGGDDGSFPQASLLYVAGTLYGVTIDGGPMSVGTVFSVDVATGAEKVIYAFQGGTDGAGPVGKLVDVGGKLYGATYDGGASGNGTLFSVDPATGVKSTLHSFTAGEFGFTSTNGGLTQVGKKLYGTTLYDGTGGQGTIFRIDLQTCVEKVMYSFIYSGANQGDGSGPAEGLIKVHGKLYGTTGEGGPFDGGTVFAYDLATQTETVVYALQAGDDGRFPNGDLIDVGGVLYGTTFFGGDADNGTIFSIAP